MDSTRVEEGKLFAKENVMEGVERVQMKSGKREYRKKEKKDLRSKICIDALIVAEQQRMRVEHTKYLKGLRIHSANCKARWEKIAHIVITRASGQVKSHDQKVKIKKPIENEKKDVIIDEYLNKRKQLALNRCQNKHKIQSFDNEREISIFFDEKVTKRFKDVLEHDDKQDPTLINIETFTDVGRLAFMEELENDPKVKDDSHEDYADFDPVKPKSK